MYPGLKGFIRNQLFRRAVLITDRHFRQEEQRLPIGPVRIRIGRHEFGKCKRVVFIRLDKPSVSHLGAQHIIAAVQIFCHIKHNILNIFTVIRPSRIKFMVGHLASIYIKVKLSQSAHLRVSTLYGLTQHKLFPYIKRRFRPVRDPFCLLCHIHVPSFLSAVLVPYVFPDTNSHEKYGTNIG